MATASKALRGGDPGETGWDSCHSAPAEFGEVLSGLSMFQNKKRSLDLFVKFPDFKMLAL